MELRLQIMELVKLQVMVSIKKTISVLCLLLFAVSSAAAQEVAKSTHVFASREGGELLLDRYTAGVAEQHPCVIFLFGGGFVGGTRDADKYLPYFEQLVRSGCDVVSIDYRLGMREVRDPGIVEAVMALRNTVDMAVEDLYAATRFVLDRADEWHIDPSRIIASGSSAGAITVLQAENGICNSIPSAAILGEEFNYGGVISFAGAVFSMSGKPEWRHRPCPMLLFHGTSDRNVPYRKGALLGIGFYGSATVADYLRESGTPHYFYSVDYEDHSMAESPMTDNMPLIISFIEDYVCRGRRLMTLERCCNEAHTNRQTEFSIFDYLGSNYGS